MENVTRKEAVLAALAPLPAHAPAALAPLPAHVPAALAPTRTRKIEDD